MKYICELCGLIYDEEAGRPQNGIAPGTKFDELPEDFECPGCFSERQAFSPYPGSKSGNGQHPSGAEMPALACSDAKETSER